MSILQNYSLLQKESLVKLQKIYDNLGLSKGKVNGNVLKKDDIIYYIIQNQLKNGVKILGEGIIEICSEGYGFLRSIQSYYYTGPYDIYISANYIKKFCLKNGDYILGTLKSPKSSERYFALSQIDKINNLKINSNYFNKKRNFEALTPLHANLMLKMENVNNYLDLTPRVLDLVAPIGRGQRGLIVAPPKAGKTILLQKIAQSIELNYKDCELIILLIDERPEEVTEMRRLVKGEVIASTFDEPPYKHIKIAEMVISRAKRLVEQKKNIVILLDSITRLARAYNTVTPTSGRIMTGGLDVNALTRPKRFFGAARNLEEGGSLTIIATALIETGSKMDDVIYEEFKGTGNMELHLSRKISDKRIFPAIDYNKSGTRKEELLLSSMELSKTWDLRKILQNCSETEAIKYIIDKLFHYKTNREFLETIQAE